MSENQRKFAGVRHAGRGEPETIGVERSFRNPHGEMDNPEAVKHAVQGGMGVAFISKFAVETELKAKILAVARVAGFSVFRELKIVYRRTSTSAALHRRSSRWLLSGPGTPILLGHS
jgi:DNA-binding transcriptional LysR family regulator